jgi:ParB-like chromosome segregation protein Spo0J
MVYEFHPLANLFPLIEGQAYQDLMADVLRHGVREPVWVYEGKILDGRNRYRAAKAVGVDFDVRQYQGNEPAAFVVSLNLHRRHLTESQRATVAAKLANMAQGERTDIEPSANLQKVSQSEAAQLLNVSPRSVAAAKKVIEEAPSEIVHAVEQGAMAVSLAAQVAELSEEKKAAIVAAPDIRAAARHAVKAKTPVGKPKTGKKAEAIKKELEEAKQRGVSLLSTYARLTLNAIRSQSEFSQEERELLAELEGAIHNLKESVSKQ